MLNILSASARLRNAIWTLTLVLGARPTAARAVRRLIKVRWGCVTIRGTENRALLRVATQVAAATPGFPAQDA